jgi:hypothetical protein
MKPVKSVRGMRQLRDSSLASKVTQKLAKQLGVRIYVTDMSWTEAMLRFCARNKLKSRVSPHPSLCVAFHPEGFVFVDPGVDIEMLAHEVIHCVYPLPKPMSPCNGAETEWECGLIAYEVAWLWHLLGPQLTRDANVDALWRKWLNYASESQACSLAESLRHAVLKAEELELPVPPDFATAAFQSRLIAAWEAAGRSEKDL